MKNKIFSRWFIALLALLVSFSTVPLQAAKNKKAANRALQMQRRLTSQQIQRSQMQRQQGQRSQGQRQLQNQSRGKKSRRNGEEQSETRAARPIAPTRQVLSAAPEALPLKESPQSVAEAAAKIDALVQEKLTEAKQKPNATTSDEQFLRRVYLDVAGRIPTGEEVVNFLSSNSPNKRAQIIDALLLSPDYRSQSFNWLADMLRLKDKVGKGGPTFTYQEWLKERIAKNSPWNETVYQMMTAEGRLINNGAAGYLLRDPGMPLDNLSNTLTTFLGANIACAQCHDHPLAPWSQRQFYEMAAFFGDIDTKVQNGNAFAKKVIKQSNEFDEKDRKMLAALANVNSSTIKVLPNKKLSFPKDYKYDDAKPGQVVHPALFTWEETDKKSAAYAVNTSDPRKRREAFATWLTHPDNPRFAVAIANRLWQKNFGLAVQEPITDLDDLSKASNPQLLVHLAAEMKRLNFDIREFQRVLYNTRTYQRQASITPDLGKGPYLFPGPVLRRMTAPQAWDSVLTLAAGTGLNYYQLKRAEALQPLVIPGEEMTIKALEEKAKTMKPQDIKMAGPNAMRYETIEGNNAPPPRFAGMILARASELEQPSKDSHFLRMFGESDREIADDSSREGGIPQILMLMNGDVQRVIGNQDALALKTAALQPTKEKQIESLYLSFLGRMPSTTEKTKVLNAFSQGMELPELTWILFNTREFIFVQ